MRAIHPLRLTTLAIACLAAIASGGEPTAGLHPYPLWPSTPVPGWPGLGADENTSPEKLSKTDNLGEGVPAKYGQPEFVAYPGSVEHVRREMQRYVPPYPVYNAATLRRNFVLGEMKGYAEKYVEWAEPVYYNPMYEPRIPTTQTRPPVKAFPWKPGSDPIPLALGKLEPSLYVVRAIAAAPAQKAVVPKKYAFLKFRINDVPDDPNEMNAYILRAQVLDNFYAIQEFYFQSLGDREFRAELSLLPESECDLLLHNIDLHDRFGECARKRGKKRSVLFNAEERHKLWEETRAKFPKEADFKRRTPEEQRELDDLVWRYSLPPLNCHTGQNLGTGQYDGKNWFRDRWCVAPAEWEGLAKPIPVDPKSAPLGLSRRPPLVVRFSGAPMLVDSRGNLHAEPPRYEVKDGQLLESGKPIGKADRFYGKPGVKYFDKEGRLEAAGELALKPGLYYDAEQVTSLHRSAPRGDFAKSRSGLGAWHMLGNPQAARDEAVRFIRLIVDWPAVRPSRQINFIMGTLGLDRRYCRRYQWWPEHHALLDVYDSLFEFIDGNEELAKAVGRYLPWVKTPDDVVALVDTRLVQDYANDMMKYRYYYDHGQAGLMMKAVLVQDDRSITDPWMEFLWTRGWEYPQALSGVADNVVTSIGRDGATNVGSIFYAIGGQLETVQLLEQYMKNGGNPKYDLTDPLHYPKLRATIDLPFEVSPAGRHVLGVGDVGGPSCAYGRIVQLQNLRSIFETGWRWTHEPKFAYELATTFGRADETDADWDQILAAAAKTRDPYLMNHSRVLADWGGYLANGVDEDDFRFKRSLSVRVGNGWGHAHSDTLDLRLWAHGVTMAGDLGQRPAYGRPQHQRSRVHNVVEVDGSDWHAHAWVRHLFDAPGAPYLVAESVPPYGMDNVKLFRRQCALIDADPGVHSGRVPPQEDPDVVTPSAYAFDVFRVSGGTTQTYCFHGCVDDGFEANVKNRTLMTGKEGDPEEAYLRGFIWSKQVKDVRPEDAEWAADPAADTLAATWRLSRDPKTSQPERRMYTGLYDKHSGAMTRPRKFTRLHLLNQTGNRILHGICMDRTLVKEHNPSFPGYAGRCLFAQRRGQEGEALDSVFVALIEPYAGEPFIASCCTLDIADNEADALRAVAVRVETTNGHTDLCFADGRPEKTRTIVLDRGFLGRPKAVVRVAAEYACLSTDAQGLRLAAVTGGRLLEAPGVKIEVADAAYGGSVAAVDYLKRRVTLDGDVPGARFAGKCFEAGNDLHKTSFEVSKVEHAKGQTILTLRKGIEIMSSRVIACDPKAGRIRTSIAMLRFRGLDRGLTASNEALTKFWKAEYVGGNRHDGHDFVLTGAPVAEGDFSVGAGLHVWEFGVGDRFSVRTGVAVRRAPPQVGSGLYEVVATSPFVLTVAGKSLAFSRDRATWQPLPGRQDGGSIRAELPAELIDGGPFYLRVER